EAGGLINLVRCCGISVGVAGASALLAWRLAVLTGSGHSTLHAGPQQLLSASRDVIILLAAFATIGAAMAFARSRSPPPGGAHAGTLAASRRNVCCLPLSLSAATRSTGDGADRDGGDTYRAWRNAAMTIDEFRRRLIGLLQQAAPFAGRRLA